MDETTLYALLISIGICANGAYEFGKHQAKKLYRNNKYSKDELCKMWEEQEKKREFFENLQIQQADTLNNISLQNEKIVQLLEQLNDKAEKIKQQQNCLINLALLNQRIQWLSFCTLSRQVSDPLAGVLVCEIGKEKLWNDELEKLLSHAMNDNPCKK